MFVKKAFLAVVAAAAVAPAFAAPSPTLYGGGATLPTIGYVGDSWLDSNPDARLSNPPDAGSIFGVWQSLDATRPTVSYCQTGSTSGRQVIIGTRNGTGTCGDYSGSPAGFSAATADAHFAASDAPISASEFNTGVTNKPARGQPVQFPAVAGAIAVIYNNNDLTSQLNLTESQICQIFAGQITDWNQLGSFPSKPIKIVYRSDGSGTSFGFSNHLSYVCPTASPVAVNGFSTQSGFAAAFIGGTPPAGSIAKSGNGGVTSEVNATDGAIGYAEVANALSVAANGGDGVKYATVSLKSGKNPITGKNYKKKNPAKNPKSFTLPTGALVADQVLGANDANGRPTLSALTAPHPGCIYVVKPDAYATSVIDPATGDYKQYPIVAVSYLLGYYQGYGEDVANVRTLLSAPYNGDVKSATTFAGAQTGLSYLGGVNLKKVISGTNSAPACINQ